ncbi:MAG: ABC transporter ATP-binding protein [Candidatus Eisenbacteria bacterium]|jgi:putative ABC transport system ATP-binding protein|nr:ABC transporter ATP-binding protein [Candidatus Eisenbacteria bacterium]
MPPIVSTHALHKVYQMGAVGVPALRGVDLHIEEGEFVAIMGASGSGKSTLMNILGCLDVPSTGTYVLAGRQVDGLSRDQRADIRNQVIGFVFQGFNLLPRASALENVELPLVYDRARRVGDPRRAAEAALTRVGLADRMTHAPNRLSGGEQQRVAIARALVGNPRLVLADEPTGNLDTRTSMEIMQVFQDLNDQGITVLLVTHEQDISRCAKRIVELRDGKVIRDAAIGDRYVVGSDPRAGGTAGPGGAS